MYYDFGIEKALCSGKAFGEHLDDDDDREMLAKMLEVQNTRRTYNPSTSEKARPVESRRSV